MQPGLSVNTPNDRSESPSSWEKAKLFVDGTEVLPGQTITLFRGRKTKILVIAPAEIATQLRVEIVNTSGLAVDIQPTDMWQEPNGEEFEWEATTGPGASGKGGLIFFSREVPAVWQHKFTAISASIRNEIRFTLDGKDHDPNQLIILNRGCTHEFRCFPQNGSPLEDSGVTPNYTIPPADGVELDWPDLGQSQLLTEAGTLSRFICGDKDGSFTFRLVSDNHEGLYHDFLAKLQEAGT